MIDKRLIKTVSESKKYIMLNVFLQWISLLCNILMMSCIAYLLSSVYSKTADSRTFITVIIGCLFALTVKFICTAASSKTAYMSSKEVKRTLREKIYTKLLDMGSSYTESVKSSEVVQVAVEGVEQLETYFGAYLPQFFYAMLAPVTLFCVLAFFNLQTALVLLICVPLIPVSIAAVQTWAKKLLSKYWGQYTALGDSFLENLQGLTTLKIYSADEEKHRQMNIQAENFRKITMKVLTMQLNSITIMDLIAYGGAGLGIIVAALQYQKGNLDIFGFILFIFLSADFFIPMRLLGSFFHIAMNGMAASDKIFKLLDTPLKNKKGTKDFVNGDIVIENLNFGYEKDRQILKNINICIKQGQLTAIAGESGSGKSTIASILMGKNKSFEGDITIGGVPLKDIDEDSLMKNVTYISHKSYLFKGTVRENLLMAKQNASDEEMWSVLEKVNLSGFLKANDGLDTKLNEKADNLSGGQCQRLALARALLHNSDVYIFDEAASNVDVESENKITEQIYKLAQEKTVIMISHRLENIVNADNIFVIKSGEIENCGTHTQLLENCEVYKNMWETQQNLEKYRRGVN